MKRALRWIGAAILGLSVLVMVLADIVLAATAAGAQAAAAAGAALAPGNGACAGRGPDTTPAAAFRDDDIQFGAATGSHQFPDPCGPGLQDGF